FRMSDIARLLREGHVRRWREGEPLAPGVSGRLSFGHTEGLVIPMIPERDEGPPIALPTDLIPTRSHLKTNWVMAYDNQPARTVLEKRALIAAMAGVGGGEQLH